MILGIIFFQRMSVIARKLPHSGSNNLEVFVKGAPETIEKLCIPSTGKGTSFHKLSYISCLYQKIIRVKFKMYYTVNLQKLCHFTIFLILALLQSLTTFLILYRKFLRVKLKCQLTEA